MCKSISSKSPAILEHFWGACAPKIREPISSQSPANLQFVYKNDWIFFNKTIIWCFGVVECTWCSRKLLSIFLFSFCVTWSCMLGYSKKRYNISRQSCSLAWHGRMVWLLVVSTFLSENQRMCSNWRSCSLGWRNYFVLRTLMFQIRDACQEMKMWVNVYLPTLLAPHIEKKLYRHGEQHFNLSYADNE